MARSYASKPKISNNSYPERKYIPGCACHAAGDFSFNTPWYFDRWKSPDITSLFLRSEHLSLPYRSGRVRSPQKGRLCSHYFKCFDGKDRLERQINTPDDQNRNRTVDITCNFCEYNRPYNRIERSILQRGKACSSASFLTPLEFEGVKSGAYRLFKFRDTRSYSGCTTGCRWPHSTHRSDSWLCPSGRYSRSHRPIRQ